MDTILLKIAKQSIIDSLNGQNTIDKNALLEKFPELDEQRATFVTLNKNGNLRGCIGSLVAHRTLLEDIISNAKSAAFNDPRFKPLQAEEFNQIDVELSILSVPKLLKYDDVADLKSKVIIGEDGIILRLDGRQATFLPQVWEQLPTFEIFFEHLCKKAGLEGDCLQRHPEIYHYQAQKIK